jgi:hypothetical protein
MVDGSWLMADEPGISLMNVPSEAKDDTRHQPSTISH